MTDGSILRFVIPGRNRKRQHTEQELPVINRCKVFLDVAVADRRPATASCSQLHTAGQARIAVKNSAARGADDELVRHSRVYGAARAITPGKGPILVIGVCAAARSKADKPAGDIAAASGNNRVVAAGAVECASGYGGRNTAAGVEASAHAGVVATAYILSASCYRRGVAAGQVVAAATYRRVAAGCRVVPSAGYSSVVALRQQPCTRAEDQSNDRKIGNKTIRRIIHGDLLRNGLDFLCF